MRDRVLTAGTALHLGDVVRAVKRSDRVRWLLPSDDVAEGTLRHFDGLANTDDVRDWMVRITSAGGLETWLDVGEILRLMDRGGFVMDGRCDTCRGAED